MKFLVQKVKHASVSVDGINVGTIDKGILLMVGIKYNDTKEITDYMIKKLINLRIFEDENNKLNLSLQDVNGELLVISQFTLYADCNSGNRPSFSDAAKSDKANELYNYIINELKEKIKKVETGKFGEHMEVELLNDGPVTIMLEK